MVLTLILLFVIISAIAILPISNRKLEVIVFFSFAFLLVMVTGFRGEGVDRDYVNYVGYFNEPDFLQVEPAFVIISKILHFFTDNPIFIFITFAALGVLLKAWAIRQLSELWLLSLVIYTGYYFILHDITQIRAGVASAFMFLCIKPVYERDLKRFLLFALLGISFHYSSLVILPFWFLGHRPRRLWLMLAIPIAYAFYFTHINIISVLPIPGIQEKIETYKALQDLGDDQWNSINVFNMVFLARVVLFYFILWKYEVIASYNKYMPILLKIYCTSLVLFLVFATMPVFAFRFYELCGSIEIILIPLISYVFKPAVFGKSVVTFIGLALMLDMLFYMKIIAF